MMIFFYILICGFCICVTFMLTEYWVTNNPSTKFSEWWRKEIVSDVDMEK